MLSAVDAGDIEAGITLLDFKSDRITQEQADKKAQEYRVQMDVYTRALEEITGLPVKERVLWFLTPSCGISL